MIHAEKNAEQQQTEIAHLLHEEGPMLQIDDRDAGHILAECRPLPTIRHGYAITRQAGKRRGLLWVELGHGWIVGTFLPRALSAHW
jgi:hypothetical protein